MAGYSFGIGGGAADLTPISQSFVNITTLTVNHGLSYFPQVWVVDTTGLLIMVAIEFGTGTVTIHSIQNISGTIYIR